MAIVSRINYLTDNERPPTHLRRILPEEEMKARRVEDDRSPNQQATLSGE